MVAAASAAAISALLRRRRTLFLLRLRDRGLFRRHPVQRRAELRQHRGLLGTRRRLVAARLILGHGNSPAASRARSCEDGWSGPGCAVEHAHHDGHLPARRFNVSLRSGRTSRAGLETRGVARPCMTQGAAALRRSLREVEA